jgi:hypothetical protein
MQELLLIVSRCISTKKMEKNSNSFHYFHFKGFYKGEKIRMLYIFQNNSRGEEYRFEKKSDYLIWGKRMHVEDKILKIEMIKCKMLN